MNEFGIALLWCAVQVTALSLAAGLCYLVARRFSPTAGSLVTLTSLMVVIALSVLAFSPWPQWTALFTETDQSTTASTETVQADDFSEDGIERTTVSENGSGTDQTETTVNSNGRITEYHAEDAPAFGALFWEAFKNELRTLPAEPGKPQPWRWPALLGSLVLAGIGVGTVRLVLGWTAVRSYRRRSRPVRDPQPPLDRLASIRIQSQAPAKQVFFHVSLNRLASRCKAKRRVAAPDFAPLFQSARR